ncbi:vacuolar protein sorting-associated protein [Achlya hypogyna]|uniref:Vacuolar protein sorting-associated protein n=1 Tax=Achlya hypogyna TaxID=1202772 RepID=A0A1V9Z1W4_ACHHY|nr:vacuolar protein sorting-associated protein [Achlya hypogyna]
MFERQVTGLLTQLLGSYVEPRSFRPDKVSVGVWNGYVVLQDLELQPKTYADLGVTVVRGVLGSITIKIPWKRLVSDSVLVTIDDVYVLLRHVERQDLVPPTAEVEARLKQALINELYSARLDTTTSSSDSFAARLRNKILDNLEFHIRRIHVRLEDPTSGDHAFAVGMTIESLHVQSTDAQWTPTYVASTEPFIYKSVELNHLSVYLNPEGPLVDAANCSLDAFVDAFGSAIPKHMDDSVPSSHHFILKPVDVSTHLKVKRDLTDPTTPSMDVHVSIDTVSLQLEEAQYCDLLFLLSALKTPQQARKYQKHLHLRPRGRSPRGWWRYAIACVQSDVRAKRERWSWLYMTDRRTDRIAYMDLWARLQQLEPAEEELKITNDRAEIQAALDAIEHRRSVEDVLLFRFLADQQLKKPQTPRPPAGYGLASLYRQLGWEDAPKAADDNAEQTELYRILGYDPDADKEAPTEFTVVSIVLGHGSITLLNDPETNVHRGSRAYGNVYAPKPFFGIFFAQLQTDVMVAPTATNVDISLQSVEMYDEASPEQPQLLKRRLPVSSLNVEITVKTPVFRMSYQTTGPSLQTLKLVLEPLEVVYSPTALCWAYWATFAQAPEALGHWAEVEVQALNELVNLKARTDAKLAYAMAHRLPMMLDVRVQAPVVVIPAADRDPHCARLVLDLGHVHFRTERLSTLDEARLHEAPPSSLVASTTFAKQLTDEAESGEGATRWKEEFYDKFALTMSNLHVMVLPPAVAYTPEVLLPTTTTPHSIVDPFHINVTLRKSVLPLDATLYRLYVHADLPALAIHLSLASYGHLTTVLDRFQRVPASTAVPQTPIPLAPPSLLRPRAASADGDARSVASDETWFSVEYGSDAEGKEVPPPTPRPAPRATTPSTRLDRRICVCTFTVPVVHVNFVKGDDDDDFEDDDGVGHGRLTFVLEGIKLRLAKRTLSTAVRLRLSSVVAEDHSENLPTQFLAFSCATPPHVPYTATAPRAAKPKHYTRKRSMAHLALLDAHPLLDLLDVAVAIDDGAPLSADVTFGHFHVHFDQSRLASIVLHVLPLFQRPAADTDATDTMLYPPPLSLNGTFEPLTESVRQDLERARHHFVAAAAPTDTEKKAPMQVKLQLHSVSVCLSDPLEHLLSMAVLDVAVDYTVDAGGSARLNGRVGNAKVLDLLSHDLQHVKKKDKRYVYQEVLGKVPLDNDAPLVTWQVSSAPTELTTVDVAVAKLRAVVATRFVLKVLHYVGDGPLMDILSTASPAPAPPSSAHRRRRDVFFSPALTYRDMAPPEAEAAQWRITLKMAKPYVVLPMVEPAADGSDDGPPLLHLLHGLALDLGDIELNVAKESAVTTLALAAHGLHLRVLHDDFTLVRPVNVHVEMAAAGQLNVSSRLSAVHLQLSEMHAALLLEWYFQTCVPVLRYLSPSPTPAAPTPTLAIDVACDAIGLSLYTARGDAQDIPATNTIYHLFPRETLEVAWVATTVLGRVDAQITTDPSQVRCYVSLQEARVQDTTIQPHLRLEYLATATTKDVSVRSKAWYVNVDPALVVQVAVVALEVAANVQHTLRRHHHAQQQSVPLEATLLDLVSSSDMTSEYQWTERGGRSRADSFASSMLFDATATTTALPTPPVTPLSPAWHVQVAIDLVHVQLGQLAVQCQVQASRNPEQLQVRLARLKWLLAESTLVEPMDATFGYSDAPIGPLEVAKHHAEWPELLPTATLRLTPACFRLHVKDLDAFQDALQAASALSAHLRCAVGQLRPSEAPVDEVLPTAAPPSWAQVHVDVGAVELHLTEMAPLLSCHLSPGPFDLLRTPSVTLLQWALDTEMWYYNRRLLAREPLLEPFGLMASMEHPVNAPVALLIESNQDLKLNITSALLDAMYFWNQMALPSALDMSSCYLRNNTGLALRVFGTQVVQIGAEVPLRPAGAGASMPPLLTVPVALDGYVAVAIPLGECSRRSHRFHPLYPSAPSLECTVDISLQQGVKWVTLESGWLLTNKTNAVLNVQLLFPSTGLLLTSPHTCLLEPRETFAVPLPLVGSRTTQMYIQPPGSRPWTLVKDGALQCGRDFVVYAQTTPSPFGRLLSFSAPLVVHNALAVAMELKLTSGASSALAASFPAEKVAVGATLYWHGCSRQDLALQVRIPGFGWSAPAFLGGPTVVSMADLNHRSLLYVNLEVLTEPQLEVTVFTPYWLLNQTGLDLEFQHEAASLGAEHRAAFVAGQPKAHKAEAPRAAQGVVIVAPPPPDTPPKPLNHRKVHHQILPSIPPNKGLLDLIPKTALLPKRAQTLLHVCHTNQSQQTLKLQCRVRKKEHAGWSSVLNAHHSGATDTMCAVPDGGDKHFSVGYVLRHGSGLYERTQVLTLVPRCLLVNALDDLGLELLADEVTGAAVALEPLAELPWHHASTLRIRFAAAGSVWSGAVQLETTGDQTLRLRNTQTRRSYLLRVSIKLEGPQYRVVFRSSTNAPPYRIENYSLETIRVHQSRVRISEILLPHQTIEYTWDEPLKPHLLIVDLLPSQADDNSRPIRIGIFSMEELQASFPTKVLGVQVLADGPTRVLRLTDPLPPSVVVAPPLAAPGLRQYVPTPALELRLHLQSIGVSVVDAAPMELLFASLEHVHVHAVASAGAAQLAVQTTVGAMQLDNQMRTTRYPVLLQCTDDAPSVDVTVVRETTYTSIEFLRYVGVHVSPMRWRIDGALVNALVAMCLTLPDAAMRQPSPTDDAPAQLQERHETQLAAATAGLGVAGARDSLALGHKKLYFEKFEISPIHVTLSFASSPTSASFAPSLASVRQILQAASKTLTKVHNAPLVWRALRWQHMFVPRETMLHQMSLHYQHEALRQAYVLLGAVDVLGNPMKVWHNLKGGVAAFVAEPVRGWQAFGVQGAGWGLLRGTTLLLRALVYALLDFNTRIASSCSLGLTEACQHLDSYSGYPLAKTLYQGLAQSVSGIVVSPIHSYQQQGWTGLFPGLLAGMLGLVLKPCRGFAQAFVATTSTLRDGLQYDIQAHVSRTRPPRYIHPRTHLLTAFSYLHATGEDIKYNIEHARADDYVGHVMLIESRKCILVTKHRVMCLEVHWNASLLNPYSVVWEVLSDDLILVVNGTPIVLYYKPETPTDWASSGLVDLVVRTQKIEVAPKQAAFVFSMLQQVTPTTLNQVDHEVTKRQYPLFVNNPK